MTTRNASPGNASPRRTSRLFRSVLPVLGLAALLAGCEEPVTESQQTGYRGTGMVQINNVDVLALQKVANTLPEPQPPAEPYPDEPRASQVYENVQVLGDLSEGEFLRVMNAITEWVSPEQGCLYCHGENLASDDIYTKVVARRMIQMTRAINTDWTAHVQQTGVTCYTCHRGNPVPLQVWSEDPGPRTAGGMSARRNGQNGANPVSGLSSLPYDPFSALLRNPDDIRVISKAALPVRGDGLGATIQETEATYGLMIHMSEALGVNCTFCHNSRSFSAWDQSSPQRSIAWYGIRMVDAVNAEYIDPLKPVFPATRLGPLGDPKKVNCATCHQEAPKPLLGASMLQSYETSLGAQAAVTPAVMPAPPAAAPAEAAPAAEPAAAPATTPEAAPAAPAPAAPAPAAPATETPPAASEPPAAPQPGAN